MSAQRFFAVVLVFAGACAGWWILGLTVHLRTSQLDDSLSAEMASLWGPKALVQPSPYWTGSAESSSASSGQAAMIRPASSKIQADIRHEHRYKGLLWYSTFQVDFTATYVVPAAGKDRKDDRSAGGVFIFPLPHMAATYHDLDVTVDGQMQPVSPADIAAGRLAIPIERTAEHAVTVHYVTGGQDAWVYSPGEAPQVDQRDDSPIVPASETLQELRDFSLEVTTSFPDIDYPKGTLSPTTRAVPAGSGMKAVWHFPHLITRQCVGIAMPKRTNAGPIAARMSFFAPVSLLFFFTVLFAVVVRKAIRLHPMHYLFIAAGFFAFHILLAYLADLVNIHPAFWISAVVSVFLVATYMRLVAGVRFAVLYAGAAQLVFLVGFSYAFFWVGRTGLTVTVGAILTLFLLMQATGRVDWHEFFRRPNGRVPPPPPGRPVTLPPAEQA